jgi:hypothetical protein
MSKEHEKTNENESQSVNEGQGKNGMSMEALMGAVAKVAKKRKNDDDGPSSTDSDHLAG